MSEPGKAAFASSIRLENLLFRLEKWMYPVFGPTVVIVEIQAVTDWDRSAKLRKVNDWADWSAVCFNKSIH